MSNRVMGKLPVQLVPRSAIIFAYEGSLVHCQQPTLLGVKFSVSCCTTRCDSTYPMIVEQVLRLAPNKQLQ